MHCIAEQESVQYRWVGTVGPFLHIWTFLVPKWWPGSSKLRTSKQQSYSVISFPTNLKGSNSILSYLILFYHISHNIFPSISSYCNKLHPLFLPILSTSICILYSALSSPVTPYYFLSCLILYPFLSPGKNRILLYPINPVLSYPFLSYSVQFLLILSYKTFSLLSMVFFLVLYPMLYPILFYPILPYLVL